MYLLSWPIYDSNETRRKRAPNVQKHEISFPEAETAFADGPPPARPDHSSVDEQRLA
jgi:uncharacterized DUF497 family protein